MFSAKLWSADEPRSLRKLRGDVLEEGLRDVEGVYIVRFGDDGVRWFGIAFGHFELVAFTGERSRWRGEQCGVAAARSRGRCYIAPASEARCI